jgi:hypothetical protein
VTVIWDGWWGGTMAESSRSELGVTPPNATAGAAIRNLQEKFRDIWQQAIANPAQRSMLAAIYDLSGTPLGDALQTFPGADLEQHRDHLNALPVALQKELIASAIDALQKQQDVNVRLWYSSDGSTAEQVTRWYSDSDPQPVQIDLAVIYPEPG